MSFYYCTFHAVASLTQCYHLRDVTSWNLNFACYFYFFKVIFVLQNCGLSAHLLKLCWDNKSQCHHNENKCMMDHVGSVTTSGVIKDRSHSSVWGHFKTHPNLVAYQSCQGYSKVIPQLLMRRNLFSPAYMYMYGVYSGCRSQVSLQSVLWQVQSTIQI